MTDTTIAEAHRALDILLLENERLAKENADLSARADEIDSFTPYVVGGYPNGPKRPNRKKLTDREVKDIRQAYQGGMKQADLASNYGVNTSTISRTVRGFYH